MAAWAEGYAGAPLTIRGVGMGSIALFPGHNGSLMPVLTQGRLPAGPGEIVLGDGTLAAFGGRAEIMDHLAPLGPVYSPTASPAAPVR